MYMAFFAELSILGRMIGRSMEFSPHSVKKNEHHGVPRSFLGSSTSENLTKLYAAEHTEFHAIAGHIPPDAFLRIQTLQFCTWHDGEGKMIPVSLIEELLVSTSDTDWTTPYEPQAIFSIENSSANRVTMAAVHLRRLLLQERSLLSRLLHFKAEQRKSIVPLEKIQRTFEFFGTENLLDVFRDFQASRTSTQERKFTKPCTPDYHGRICSVLHEAQPERRTRPLNQRIDEVLVQQWQNLQSRFQTYTPKLEDYPEAIIEFHRIQMQEALFQMHGVF